MAATEAEARTALQLGNRVAVSTVGHSGECSGPHCERLAREVAATEAEARTALQLGNSVAVSTVGHSG